MSTRVRERGDGGFALVAVVLVMMTIVATFFVVTVVAFLDVTVSNEEETQRRLAKLVEVIAGIPEGEPGATQGTHGFIGDMGRLPKSLEELNDRAATHTLCNSLFNPASPPNFHTADGATNHRGRLGIGWAGPYYKEMIYTDEHLRDAWGVKFRYTCPETTRTEAGVSLTLRTGTITSGGRDGVFDTGDDISAEPFYDRGHFYLTVSQGGSDNAANNVDVTLYYVSNGEQTSVVAEPITVSGPEGSEVTVVFASIPAGIRFAQIDFGGSKRELYYSFVRSNVATRINVKIPVGGGGKG